MSASKQRWRRVGKGSGPANVLDDRWEVKGSARDWVVVDLTTGEMSLPFPTMGMARDAALAYAADGHLPAVPRAEISEQERDSYLRSRYLESTSDEALIGGVADAEARLRRGASGFPGTRHELLAYIRDATIELRYRNELEATG